MKQLLWNQRHVLRAVATPSELKLLTTKRANRPCGVGVQRVMTSCRGDGGRRKTNGARVYAGMGRQGSANEGAGLDGDGAAGIGQ
jgi:hypothetical protein